MRFTAAGVGVPGTESMVGFRRRRRWGVEGAASDSSFADSFVTTAFLFLDGIGAGDATASATLGVSIAALRRADLRVAILVPVDEIERRQELDGTRCFRLEFAMRPRKRIDGELLIISSPWNRPIKSTKVQLSKPSLDDIIKIRRFIYLSAPLETNMYK